MMVWESQQGGFSKEGRVRLMDQSPAVGRQLSRKAVMAGPLRGRSQSSNPNQPGKIAGDDEAGGSPSRRSSQPKMRTTSLELRRGVSAILDILQGMVIWFTLIFLRVRDIHSDLIITICLLQPALHFMAKASDWKAMAEVLKCALEPSPLQRQSGGMNNWELTGKSTQHY